MPLALLTGQRAYPEKKNETRNIEVGRDAKSTSVKRGFSLL